MTLTSPLRGPGSPGGGFAAADPSGAAQGTGPPLRPPGCCASRCARQPCGLPRTPETAAAPGARKSGQAQACPRAARGAQTPQWRTRASTRTLRGADELAFDTDKEENLSYRSQTLESVKHHLKPNRQRSVGPRHQGTIVLSRLMLATLAPFDV